MLKKLSLIFIKISSSILALDLFLKLMLIYFPINLLWIEIIDTVSKMILSIGFVVLSIIFKYCWHHRSLFYIVIIGNILYLSHLIITIDITVIMYFIFGLIISITVMFIIIYFYLNGRNKEIITRKQSNVKGD
jgi:hypothetical protein